MREIKFKGKRIDNGEWVYGYYVESNRSWNSGHPHKSWILDSPFTNGGWFALKGKRAVIDNTVCQFTGLRDKNGKEIYEGDILRSDKYPFSCFNDDGTVELDNYYAVVFWFEEEACFQISCEKSRTSKVVGVSSGINSIIDDPTIFEVIGNIHENHELLEQ